jgi:hypothetical protein
LKKRRPRFYSENVRDKKIEIKNFNRFSIEDNYAKNKNNSNSKTNLDLDSTKFNSNEEQTGKYFNFENKRKLTTPMYYSDYFTVIKI